MLPLRNDKRCTSLTSDRLDHPRRLVGHHPARLRDPAANCVLSALAELATVQVDAAHPCRRRERDKGHRRLPVPTTGGASPKPEALLGQDDDTPALGSLIRQR